MPKEVSGIISENKPSHSPEDKNVSNYKVLTHSNNTVKTVHFIIDVRFSYPGGWF